VQLTIDVGGEKIEKRWCDPNFPTTGAETCKDYPLITPNISIRSSGTARTPMTARSRAA
jgi:hypothetical protein